MNLTYLPEISLRNKVAQRITAQLIPSYLPQSVLFQRAEGDSLVADPSGNLIVKVKEPRVAISEEMARKIMI